MVQMSNLYRRVGRANIFYILNKVDFLGSLGLDYFIIPRLYNMSTSAMGFD